MKVWNKYKEHPKDAVYIGRGSPWGNPFVIGKDGNRSEVIEKYKEWFLTQNIDVTPLKGKHLLCFCAPQECHGDFLLQIANT